MPATKSSNLDAFFRLNQLNKEILNSHALNPKCSKSQHLRSSSNTLKSHRFVHTLHVASSKKPIIGEQLWEKLEAVVRKGEARLQSSFSWIFWLGTLF
ncbi:hypothetical protein J1N35_016152 [Gossypium stocksii]|uniref:Uncharacterized protein n=1 Tax=Gossypium stocksii TaxID=47602 RepID=A0A9D4ABD6_9ROSI|nr:hypothetical protein J1N35_016152 [Gossypium stocksii]